MTRILIIGGGVAGLSAAAALSGDADITLVEAESQLGYHASGRSAAAFIEDYGNATVQTLNRASLAHLQDIPNLMRRRVMMMVGRAGENEALAKESADLGMTPVSLDDAQSQFPILDRDVLTCAALRDDAYDIDTGLLMNHLQAKSKQAGARILTRAPLTELRHTGEAWQARAGDHDLSAEIVINAAGAWADQVAALGGVRPVGLQPFRRSMARIAAPDGYNTRDWAFIDGVGETFYCKPDAGALLVSPADETPMSAQDAWADDMELAEGLARYESFVTAPVTRMLANWAGLRTFAPDRALVIGADTGAPGFFWLAGQGGYGFQTAFGAAALLRSHVLGQPSDLSEHIVAALSPARFA